VPEMAAMRNRKIEIVCEGINTQVFFDGVKQFGLRDIRFSHSYNSAPELSLTFIPFVPDEGDA